MNVFQVTAKLQALTLDNWMHLYCMLLQFSQHFKPSELQKDTREPHEIFRTEKYFLAL